MARNTLLIIGNGFDLQCGLQSSYLDFFEWLRKNDDIANSNFWVIYLLNNLPNGQLWSDVEESLREVLKDRYHDKSVIRNLQFHAGLDVSMRFGAHSTLEGKHKKIVEYISDNLTVIKQTRMYWYLDQLRIFERIFSDYLKTEVSNNVYYQSNGVKLMWMLVNHGHENVYVISFNYTNPFNQALLNINSIKSVINVHGTYQDDNIIFGVDATEKLVDDAYIFTKTHRKLLQGGKNEALPRHVKKIKFYGHSLGNADYSYFQSIFDHYNLYGDNLDLLNNRTGNKPVELLFYFAIFDKNREIEIRRDATENVYKLITTYSNSLDNEAHRKNLLHKLLLEGRIKIEFM